jgi:membrane fusion protein (multidrug efflux system)
MKKIVVIIVIFGFLGFTGYKVKLKLEENRVQQSMVQNGGPNVTVPLVKTLEVTLEPIRETLELVGSIKAETEIAVQPRISGRLVSLTVEEGYEVKKGDLIGTIDDEAILLQMQQIEANIIGIKANLNQAEVNAARLKAQKERYRELLEKRYISQWDYDQAENSYIAAEATVDNVRAQLDIAEKNYQLQKIQLDQTRIYAPEGGYVLQKLVTPGVNLTSGTTIVTVAPLSPVKLTFNIDQKEAAKVRKGMAVDFVSDALPGRVFTGKINQVAPVYDPNTRTLGLTVSIANDDHSLMPGMFGTVTIIIGGKDFALVAPQEAVLVQNGQTGVFVVGPENVVRFQPVKTGLAAEGRVEIVSGLKTGDLIVVVGQNRLRDGQKVEVFGDSRERKLGNNGREKKSTPAGTSAESR